MILDVGCGSHPRGHVNVDLFLAPIHRVRGETINPKKVRNFVKAHILYLPFPDNSFTVVFCSHVLEHMLEPLHVLVELRRVSKNTVYINIPHAYTSIDKQKYHLYSWTPNSLKNLLEKVFPHVDVYATERPLYKSPKIRGFIWIRRLLILLIRKMQRSRFRVWRLLFAKQITAICHV